MESRAAVQTSRRLFLLAALCFLWAILILFRLVDLQVVRHKALREQADRQTHGVAAVEAPRGAILDRTGRILAKSLFLDSVCVNPMRLPDPAVAADILAGVLDVDRQELYERIRPSSCASCHKSKRRGFVWVKRRISPSESERLRSMNLDWVEFRRESQRYYPNGPLAAHVVGTVDHAEKGNLGLEQSLNRELSGHPGFVKMLRDVKQRGIESQVATPAEPGSDVVLSLNASIQFVAEQELAAAAELYHATTGSVVVMRPDTGEVLAMASYPPFDPNVPPESEEDLPPRFDQPVSVPFEPGSVFKIITLSAALDTTNLRPDTLIPCGGGKLNLFGRVIHEAKQGYGVLSMTDVLVKSSNIGAIQIGLKVGEARLLEYVRRFGFGTKTGIPLPAESSGMVRDLKLWRKSSIGSVAMGHEISTTTLQLAQAASVIANGGFLVKPRLILRRQRPGGQPQPELVESPRRVLKPESVATMRQMMEGVILRGTGRRARLNGYTAGGKTGSAQIFDPVCKCYTHFYNGSFVGFAPVTRPAIVVAVTLNHVRLFGGVVAAPVFQQVATKTLRMLDVPKDLEEGPPPADNEPVEADDLAIAELSTPPTDLGMPALPLAPQAAPTAPSFAGKTVRAVLEESLASGLRVELVGHGIARNQAPPAGSPLGPGQRVKVVFE